MIQDLHAHTYYSFCSEDKPERVIERAAMSGVELLGFCDHNYGVAYGRAELCWGRGDALGADYGGTLRRYNDHIKLLGEKYKKKLKVLSGIEICTLPNGKDAYTLPHGTDVSFFDYCLIENLDNEGSITKRDLFSYAERLGTKVGVAHTDMFSFIRSIGEEPYRYFKRMAERDIFWEINVNYDSLHSFKSHDYVTEFFKNGEQQQIIRRAGVKLSVGFDSHIISEYKPMRIQNACNLIKSLGIRLAFEGCL